MIPRRQVCRIRIRLHLLNLSDSRGLLQLLLRRTIQELPRQSQAREQRQTQLLGNPHQLTLPIGAKSAPAKVPAKYASGAIGAPVPPKGKAKAKAKNQGGSAPSGASSTVKQGIAKQSQPAITSDTALEYLRDAPATQSFADYQSAQDTSAQPDTQNTQNVQDDQTAQDEQIARAVQADLDAQAVQGATSD